MRKLFVLLLSAGWCATALSQNLLQCINPDVVRSLLLPTNSGNAVAVTADAPPGLDDIVTPQGFDWIGGVDGEARDVIAYRTALAPLAAKDAALDALEAAGWESFDALAGRPATFFLADAIEATADVAICRANDIGRLAVRNVSGTRYVSVSLETQNGSGGCMEQQRQLERRRTPFGGASEYLPSLEFPADTTGRNGAGSLGFSGGGSDRDFGSRTTIESDSTAATLAEHLGRQLSAQGWLLDSSATGRLSAISNWTRQQDSGSRLIGTLDITDLAGRSYEVEFRVRTSD